MGLPIRKATAAHLTPARHHPREGLAIVATSSFEIYTSADDGVSWQRVAGPQEKTHPWYHGEFGFAHDDTTMYVFRRYPARVMSASLQDRHFEVLDLPTDVKEIRDLDVLGSQIILQRRAMAWSDKSPQSFLRAAAVGGRLAGTLPAPGELRGDVPAG
jgi:hypothetical protein